MGCGASSDPPPADEAPPKPKKLISGLTPEEAEMVQSSWERANAAGTNNKAAFFEKLKEHDDANKKLQEHTKGKGCQFWESMQDMVSVGLDTDKEKYKNLKETLKALGKKHVDYELEEYYYGQYYRTLVTTIEVSADEEKAWRKLYMWGSKIAVEAHRKESKKRKRKKDEAEASERLKQQMLQNDSDLPSDAQRVMVQHQMKSLEDYKKFDEIYFKNLFEKEPSLKDHFTGKNGDGTPDTSKCTVKDSVIKSVAMMADLEKLMEYNESIGLVHHKAGVPEKHYYAAWLAYMDMIPKIFKDLYPELQLAWKSSFNLFTTCMIPDEEDTAPMAGMPAPEPGGVETIEAD